MNSKIDKDKEKLKKRLILQTFILLINAVIVVVLYLVLIIYGYNLIILILIILFAVLTISGPFLRKEHKKKFYSDMFPDKNRNPEADHPRFQKEQEKRDRRLEENLELKVEKLSKIDLSVDVKKPLIGKCEKCKMIIPNFVEKCPNCGQIVKR